MNIRTVSILGTLYTINYADDEEDEKLTECNGYCDYTEKKIVVRTFKKDKMSFNDLNYFQNKIVRHEIIHAFLYESGLANNSNWAENEEAVDWIAIQLEKIYNACLSVSAMNKETRPSTK